MIAAALRAQPFGAARRWRALSSLRCSVDRVINTERNLHLSFRTHGLQNGGEGEIRTHVPELPDHPISSRRRYDHFGTSPLTYDPSALT